MAASMACCIHVCQEENSELCRFSVKNYLKICERIQEWITLDGTEQKVAEHLSVQGAGCNEHTPLFSGNAECMQCNICSVYIATLGYHARCYSRFTDKTKVERAKKRVANQRKNSVIPDGTATAVRPTLRSDFCKQTPKKSICDEEGPTPTPPKQMPATPALGVDSRKRLGLFPIECCICTSTKYMKEKCSRKRIREKLVQCMTYDAAAKLEQAARVKNNERLLLKVQDIDLVAKEAHYHKSCYRELTRERSENVGRTNESGRPFEFRKSFDRFCQEVIESRIVTGGEVLRMKELNKLFTGEVCKDLGHEIVYRNHQLKRLLKHRYPQLIFVKNHSRNASELVLSELRHVSKVIQDESSSQFSDTDSETEDEHAGNAVHSGEQRSKSLHVQAGMRDLYRAALYLRSVIEEIPNNYGPWPPIGNSLDEDAVKSFVPHQLFNFLAWCTSISDDVEMDDYVKTKEESKDRLYSVGQDIVYLASNGRKQTPKHLALGMTIRHISGSSKLIGILNGLGHSVSHSKVLEYDTALAEKQLVLGGGLPSELQKKTPTTLAWDNNDFGEETSSGAGTTHNTNGIAIQRSIRPETPDHQLQDADIQMKKSHKRTVQTPEKDIVPYFSKKKEGPQRSFEKHDVDLNASTDSDARLADTGYILSKMSSSDTKLPGWTGFHTLLHSTQIPAVSTVSYLPVIDGSPTEMSTVYTILQGSIRVADQLELKSIVLVFDQAIYYKAQQIRWKDIIMQSRLVIRLGQFHTAKTFLAVIGKRFKDAGLGDILVEAGTVAAGSLASVMNGNHYNRAIRSHKLTYEALQRLCLIEFMAHSTDETVQKLKSVSDRLSETFPDQEYHEILISEECQEISQHFDQFISGWCEERPTFQFWLSYMSMVECLLMFIRASREGNWDLQLTSLRTMVAWFFAYDRTNYARYTPAYLLEMANLEKTHPDVYEDMINGGFVVQRQTKYGFSQVPVDQTIEQTMNRDSKTKGGLTGITLRKSAVHRWILSHPARAAISHRCEEMAGKTDDTRTRKDLDGSRIAADERDVENIMETVRSMCNPFTVEDENIVNLSTGCIAPPAVEKDLIQAEEVGQVAYECFVEERLIDANSDKDIYSPLKLLKLKSFSDVGRKVEGGEKGHTLVLKANVDILGRMVVIGKIHNIDMKDALCYSLHPFPPSLSNQDGTIAKTSKAKLRSDLERLIPSEVIDSPPFSGEGSVWILDGMALLQAVKGVPSTFGALADNIFMKILSISLQYEAQRIDFVPDRYPTDSIKGGERERRSSLGTQKIKITGRDQRTPKQFKKYIACGENKEQLLEFFFQEWQRQDPQKLGDLQLMIGHGNKCHKLIVEDGVIQSSPIPELCCDHEEADSRMFLHARHAVAEDADVNVVIRSQDTDVFVLATSLAERVSPNLYVHLGPWSESYSVHINYLSRKLGDQVSQALIGLHCLTGCDSTSALKGQGKKKALTLMLGNETYQEMFQHLGNEWDLSDDDMAVIEKFICELYGKKCMESVNEFRYRLFQTKFRIDSTLPPNQDALRNHAKRANYQAAIHRRALMTQIDAPSPVGCGWEKDKDGTIIPLWNTLQFAPDSLLKHLACRCKKSKCIQGHCPCFSQNLPCTPLCQCENCENCHVSEGQDEVVEEIHGEDDLDDGDVE